MAEYTKEQLKLYAEGVAKKNGLVVSYFVNQIQQESKFNPNAYNAGSGATGIAQIIKKWHPSVDPTDPIASLDYAGSLMKSYLLRYEDKPNPYWYALAAYNWGSGNVDGYVKLDGTVVPPWSGLFRDLPVETQNYITIITGEENIVVSRYYGSDTPDSVIKQKNDWTCSVRSLYAALHEMHGQGEISFDPTYGDGGPHDVYNMMVPHYVNSSLGLLDGTLNGMVQLLARLGIPSQAYQNVTLEQVKEVAGTRPIIVDGHNWFITGHLAYLRGIDEEGLLVLENPASNAWYGITDKIHDSWNKSVFGPWSMLVIGKPANVQQKTPTASLDNSALTNLVGNAYHTDGVIIPALTAIITNPEYDATKMRVEIRNVINWLLDQNLA